jgi:GTP-binding protein YchF
MRIGILGLPKSGKTTLFNLLTASELATDKFRAAGEAHVGIARVPDRRLERLRDLYEPRKYTPATVEFIDIPGLKRGESRESLDLDRLRTVDALMQVVRGFEDLEIHPAAADPAGDVAAIELELVLADHELVERRLSRLAQNAKRGLKPEEEREQRLLAEKILPQLESGDPVRELELDADEERMLRGFQLLTVKPKLLVLNVGEEQLGSDESSLAELPAELRARTIVVSAPIEGEIARLEAEEQREFLADLGLDEPSLDRVIRSSYEMLSRIAFFTVGEDEVRAWTIRAGTSAREAGGAIHSDIARGFIRAEVVPWDDLLRLGSLAACREQGLLRLEGKDYVIQDGDVAHFRFNV